MDRVGFCNGQMKKALAMLMSVRGSALIMYYTNYRSRYRTGMALVGRVDEGFVQARDSDDGLTICDGPL